MNVTLVMVCGLPAMYDSLCGPRTEADLADGTVLKALGYSKLGERARATSSYSTHALGARLL